MERIFNPISRRNLLKLFLALPLSRPLEKFLGRLLGLGPDEVVAATSLKVAKISQLQKPWGTAAFEYSVRLERKNVKGAAVNEEYLPGLVVRLPDDLAQKRGGGVKEKFYAVSLLCTHQRCKTAFIPDPTEIAAVSERKVENPVFFCPCHASLFDATKEAEPMKGSEAKLPLWKFDFQVKGDDIIITGVDPKAATWDPGRAGGLSSEYPVRPGERGL